MSLNGVTTSDARYLCGIAELLVWTYEIIVDKKKHTKEEDQSLYLDMSGKWYSCLIIITAVEFAVKKLVT